MLRSGLETLLSKQEEPLYLNKGVELTNKKNPLKKAPMQLDNPMIHLLHETILYNPLGFTSTPLIWSFHYILLINNFSSTWLHEDAFQ